MSDETPPPKRLMVEARIVREGATVLTRQCEYRKPEDLDAITGETTTEFRRRFYGDSLLDRGFNLVVDVVRDTGCLGSSD